MWAERTITAVFEERDELWRSWFEQQSAPGGMPRQRRTRGVRVKEQFVGGGGGVDARWFVVCTVGRETLQGVTTPEPWPADGPKLSVDATEDLEHVDAPTGSAGLNQPWRAAVAGIELVIAVALLVAAWWAWGRGTVTIYLPGPQGAVDVVTRSIGSWLAAAVGAVTLAGLLVLDGIRQVVLASRARGRESGV
jgi:hypothetical protein